MIRNKTIKFNLDNTEDRELWEWLQHRPHGTFSEQTKSFWRGKMSEGISVGEAQRVWQEKQKEERK